MTLSPVPMSLRDSVSASSALSASSVSGAAERIERRACSAVGRKGGVWRVEPTERVE